MVIADLEVPSFPVPLELASAWDTALIHTIGRAIAAETRALGVDMILGPST